MEKTILNKVIKETKERKVSIGYITEKANLLTM